MKFVIDENLSPEVAEIFRKEGVTAYHINQMKSRKGQRVIDDQIRRLSLDKDYIVVTKDDDFVKSYVDRKVPDKMVFVFGMDNKAELLSRLKKCVPESLPLLKVHDFIEITKDEIRTPFS